MPGTCLCLYAILPHIFLPENQDPQPKRARAPNRALKGRRTRLNSQAPLSAVAAVRRKDNLLPKLEEVEAEAMVEAGEEEGEEEEEEQEATNAKKADTEVTLVHRCLRRSRTKMTRSVWTNRTLTRKPS